MMVLTSIASLFGGAGAAAGTAAGATATAAAATGAAATTAASGLSLGSILSGAASVLGVVSTLAGASAEAEQMRQAAADADAEQSLETLQGISRRSSIKREMEDALGAQDVAYAASGVDLSHGTAARARTDAFREADLALSSDAGTEMTRKSRLAQRAANYRSMAKRSMLGGFLKAGMGLASSFGS